MTTVVLLLLISFIIVSGAFVFINTKSDDEAHAQLSAPNDTKQDVDPVTDEIVCFDSKLASEENHAIASSFENEVEEPSEAVTEKVSDNIHRMTHQKVRAEHKWGHLRITDERIDEMISLLEQYDVPDRTFLHEEMLNWKNGDYSNSVEIHNTLTQISDYSVRIGKDTDCYSQPKSSALSIRSMQIPTTYRRKSTQDIRKSSEESKHKADIKDARIRASFLHTVDSRPACETQSYRYNLGMKILHLLKQGKYKRVII